MKNDSVKDNIKAMLIVNPELKSNYNNLLYHYWTLVDKVKTPADICKATPAETITRCFRDVVRPLKNTEKEKLSEVRAYKSDISTLV